MGGNRSGKPNGRTAAAKSNSDSTFDAPRPARAVANPALASVGVPTGVLWLLLLAGIASRVALCCASRGTNDTISFLRLASLVDDHGLIASYRPDPLLNHPPIPDAYGIAPRGLLLMMYSFFWDGEVPVSSLFDKRFPLPAAPVGLAALALLVYFLAVVAPGRSCSPLPVPAGWPTPSAAAAG